MLTSHPSLQVPLQSARPGSQVSIEQALAVHSAVLPLVCIVLEQLTPVSQAVVGPEVQPPQLVLLAVKLSSQPSLQVPLQSARPGSHVAMAQAAELQAALAPDVCMVFVQLLPQAPQLATEDWRPVSQPSQGSPSQSP